MTKKVYKSENAAARKSYVGSIFREGEELAKQKILDSLPSEWKELHTKGYIHIHDLDAYGMTYNCLTFNLNKFPYKMFEKFNTMRKILGVFDYYRDIIAKIGNEQSGGMAFANFDCDTAEILHNLAVDDTENNRTVIKCCISSFIFWISNCKERMGQVNYYVTLNIGLAETPLAQFICESVIDEFENASLYVIKPNIVFKVKDGINRFEKDKNYSLLQKSFLCTAKKMIPTYLLGDSNPNKNINIKTLSVMGCRTRIVQNLFGEEGSIGRGNIDNITINLPRIALEIDEKIKHYSIEDKLTVFKQKYTEIAEQVKDILIDRYKKLLEKEKSDFPTNNKYDLWVKEFSDAHNSLEDIFKNGTLSIGFIGLSEALEILTKTKFYTDERIYYYAIDFVSFMRKYCDSLREKYALNFSLLATSGELISGRFPELDKKLYKNPVLDKGFYTNSFHIDVNSGLSAFEKIEKEGQFHEFCNGGCITYIELGESPLGNTEGLKELIEKAITSGIHYIGFNFPLDVCNDCGEKGVFDKCFACGSSNIIHIRRVSGYLEILDYFTSGKKAEEKNRRRN